MYKNSTGEKIAKIGYSWVYYYLLAGIALVMAVFLFLPKISVG